MSNIIKAVTAAAEEDRFWAGAASAVSGELETALSRAGRETVIVSRHPAAIEWLAAQGITGPVISGNATPEDVRGKVVVGNLPLHLAALAHQIGSIDLPGLRRDQRGGDLTVQEMVEAGAVVRWYVVEAI